MRDWINLSTLFHLEHPPSEEEPSKEVRDSDKFPATLELALAEVANSYKSANVSDAVIKLELALMAESYQNIREAFARAKELQDTIVNPERPVEDLSVAVPADALQNIK